MADCVTVKVVVSQKYLNNDGRAFTPTAGEIVEVMGDTYVASLVEEGFVELYEAESEEIVEIEAQPVLADLSMSELKEVASDRGIEKIPRKRADLLKLLEE